MDTPQCKISIGRGAGHLVSSLMPGPVVVAPGPLVAARSLLVASPDYAIDDINVIINDTIVAQAYDSINSVNPVTIKLPELWRSRVCGWIAQAVAQFATRGVTASLTKYYNVVQALNESSIDRIPDLMTLPAEDPYMVLKCQLIQMYDLSDFQRAELLMALPLVVGDMHPSELIDKMKGLMPPEELERPSILFWHAFLTCLPADIRVHCVPFTMDVAQRTDVQFLARP